MEDDAKVPKRKRFKHWFLFASSHDPSIPYEKSGKRLEAGVCIGCGKNPCVCKNPRRAKRR